MVISSPMLYGLATAAAYGTVSVTITLFNKAVFSYYAFGFPLSLFVAQMAFTLLALLTLRAAGTIDFPQPSMAVVRPLIPLATMWWIYGVSGVIAIRYLNVPMFSTFRKLSTLVVMCGEYYVFHKVPPFWNRMAVLLMSVGAMAAGLTDLTFTIPGYFWVTVCAFSTAFYLLLIAKVGSPTGLNNFGLLFYNNVVAFPLMLLTWFFSSERTEVWQYEHIADQRFIAFFCLTAAQASVLNYLIFLCTRVNSPLTTSITGTIKDLVTNAFGLFIFGDVLFTASNLGSIAICFIASCWYSYLKYQQSRPKTDVPLRDVEAASEKDEDKQGN